MSESEEEAENDVKSFGERDEFGYIIDSTSTQAITHSNDSDSGPERRTPTNGTSKRSAQDTNKENNPIKEFACDVCDFATTRSYDLKNHIKVKHEGKKFPCNQCSYEASKKSYLKQHQRIKHEGFVFACDQCDYVCCTKKRIEHHKATIHEGFTHTIQSRVKLEVLL